ncbi:NAD(P)/FAD-dependent oxidoreductase [Nocardia sp. NPDC052566]|uniref:NAD(P)/FAD-dependent oxidoreductase n=1 Tax=Nocardia sp. NPDC052566 TaxID=3364330 RepID=UPI0037C842AF
MEFLVVGAGMAGAAAGYFLSAYGTVTLLEMESAPGYHATGRSAALFSEYFGTPIVRALTAASRRFLQSPPTDFTGNELLHPRGVLAVGADDADFAQALADGLAAEVPVRRLAADEVSALCPVLKPFPAAMFKPGAMDIDVAALHQGFLSGIRRCGGRVLTKAGVRRLTRRGARWRAETESGHDYEAPIVVNAAGAWADQLATSAGVRPVGLIARRRTACVADVPGTPRDWPLVTDVADTFYFRPESGGLLLSAADATETEPGDARPADIDVALAAERIERATTLRIQRIRHAWAGLRTFTPDESPVLGEAPDQPGFFWMAGFGGYGIQTAPEAGRRLAAAVTGTEGPADALSAARFW